MIILRIYYFQKWNGYAKRNVFFMEVSRRIFDRNLNFYIVGMIKASFSICEI